MDKAIRFFIIAMVFAAITSCGQNSASQETHPPSGSLKILAVESFLADMTRNVAGERASVEVLIPLGLDPHAFEPTPKDVARIAESDVVIVNGNGLEEWLDETLENAGGDKAFIVASANLTPLTPQQAGHEDEVAHAIDPHFWFDPVLAIEYVKNIRDGLIKADPQGKSVYNANAQAYIKSLELLHNWVLEQMAQIPPDQRLIVTNHESFGYFASRYGIKIVGAVLPSVSTSAAPSAQQMTELIRSIKETGAKAIFLETGANPEIAEQIANETGAQLVTGLYSHSLSEDGGPASTYIDMMRHNVSLIVEALK